jgi:hypothetical protein
MSIVFGCSSSSVVVPFYARHLEHSTSHLEIGPGAGWFTAQPSIISRLNKLKRFAIFDINRAPLQYSAKRAIVAGYKGPEIELHEHSVLQPLPPVLRGAFDSIALVYVLHCVPGSFPTKASHAAATILPALVPGPNSTLYGTTVLGRGTYRNVLTLLYTWFFNSRGIWFNYGDDAEGLKAGMTPYFDEVEINVVGCVAMFVCRGPKSQRVA